VKNRIPNHKIDGMISNLSEFTNYNGSIRAEWRGNRYTVTHWQTVVFEYEQGFGSLRMFYPFISQTTSVLLGRIVRNFPHYLMIDSVIRNMPKSDARRFRGMLNR
jgi:hypothetical protein